MWGLDPGDGIAVVIGVFGVIVGWRGLRKAGEANTIAGESGTAARQAVEKADTANRIAYDANRIANRAVEEAKRSADAAERSVSLGEEANAMSKKAHQLEEARRISQGRAILKVEPGPKFSNDMTFGFRVTNVGRATARSLQATYVLEKERILVGSRNVLAHQDKPFEILLRLGHLYGNPPHSGNEREIPEQTATLEISFEDDNGSNLLSKRIIWPAGQDFMAKTMRFEEPESVPSATPHTDYYRPA